MQKLHKLREFVNSLPLKLKADNIILFAETGSIKGDSEKAFQYEFDALLTILEFTGDADEIVYPIYLWYLENQPASPAGFQFEAEILDHEGVDIEFTLPLTERVIVTESEGGHYLTHCDDTVSLDTGYDSDWEVFIKDKQIYPVVADEPE